MECRGVRSTESGGGRGMLFRGKGMDETLVELPGIANDQEGDPVIRGLVDKFRQGFRLDIDDSVRSPLGDGDGLKFLRVGSGVSQFGEFFQRALAPFVKEGSMAP